MLSCHVAPDLTAVCVHSRGEQGGSVGRADAVHVQKSGEEELELGGREGRRERGREERIVRAPV